MNESYDKEWRELKKRSRLFWFSFLGYIPGTIIIGLPLSKLCNSETAIYIIAVFWMLFFAASGIYLQIFKCPRCHKNYFFKKRGIIRIFNIFSRKCLNCGLKKWQGNLELPQTKYA